MPRVYLPLTPDQLRVLHETGSIPADSLRLVAASTEEDDEYAALEAAADESAALLPGLGHRVVVVAELPGADPDAEVPLRRVVAVHADDDPVDPAYLGDTGPAGSAGPPVLGWWAVQELPDLLAHLARP